MPTRRADSGFGIRDSGFESGSESPTPNSQSRRVLPRSFYERPTLVVAEKLLGKVLVHRTREGVASGAIVETEAYIGEDDPACHASFGRTARSEPLYGPAGVAYVYLNYGIHYLVNAVTEADGHPAAVLIRALQPLDGIALMHKRRAAAGRVIADRDLCRGPGNLSKALGITLADNRLDLVLRLRSGQAPRLSSGQALRQGSGQALRQGSGQAGGKLWIEDRGIDIGEVARGPRVGIRVAVERPWRYWVEGHGSVSAHRKRA